MITRDEHLAWVKGRALAELAATPGPCGVINALATMQAELRANHTTRQHPAVEDAARAALNGELDVEDPAAVREWIEATLR